jgi:abortive infection bacteriophage resistance protein
LRTIGYYRLSAYTHTFRRRTPAPNDSDSLVLQDVLIEGTSAEHVLRLYEFDRRLKLLVLDAVERIEIAVRFSLAHTLGGRDPFGHLNPDSLDARFTAPSGHDAGYAKWLEGYGNAQERAKEAFVTHFETEYDGRLPIWVAVEIMHFGQLSVLYKGLKPADRHSICSSYGVPDPKVLSSWLRSMTYLRNVCAHPTVEPQHDCPAPCASDRGRSCVGPPPCPPAQRRGPRLWRPVRDAVPDATDRP